MSKPGTAPPPSNEPFLAAWIEQQRARLAPFVRKVLDVEWIPRHFGDVHASYAKLERDGCLPDGMHPTSFDMALSEASRTELFELCISALGDMSAVYEESLRRLFLLDQQGEAVFDNNPFLLLPFLNPSVPWTALPDEDDEAHFHTHAFTYFSLNPSAPFAFGEDKDRVVTHAFECLHYLCQTQWPPGNMEAWTLQHEDQLQLILKTIDPRLPEKFDKVRLLRGKERKKALVSIPEELQINAMDMNDLLVSSLGLIHLKDNRHHMMTFLSSAYRLMNSPIDGYILMVQTMEQWFGRPLKHPLKGVLEV